MSDTNVIVYSPVRIPPVPRFIGYIVRFKAERGDFDVPTMAHRHAARHAGGPPQHIFTESLKGFTVGRIPEVAVRRLRFEDAVESVEPDLELDLANNCCFKSVL
jgi:hypothetical protein